MVKIIIVLISGLVLGVGLTAALRQWGPFAIPGRSTPRPNLRKSKFDIFILPVVGAMIICLLAWAGLGLLLFPDKPEDEKVANAVSQTLPGNEEQKAGNEEPPPSKVKGRGSVQEDGRRLLVADSPLARAALKVSPVSSRLDVVGSQAKSKSSAVWQDVQVSKKAEDKKPVNQQKKPAAQTPASTTAQKKKKPEAAERKAATNPNSGLEFTVHLASFSEKANADRNLAKLKAAGAPAFVSRIQLNSGVWHRLMVGRFKTRSKAEAYGRELKQKGLTTEGAFTVKPIVIEPDSG